MNLYEVMPRQLVHMKGVKTRGNNYYKIAVPTNDNARWKATPRYPVYAR